MQSSYSISEIFHLAESGQIELPTVQRNFVWRPWQIENFWDSLLRGYPIGSFVFAKQESTLSLLDGQQRATSIYLAFCDPEFVPKNPAFRITTEKIQIFLDLGKLNFRDSRKYVFRVITKSQPWGYQRIDNKKTLDSKEITKAQKLYPIHGTYLTTPLKNFHPYDAYCPVPFSFFLQSQTYAEVKEKIDQLEKTTKYSNRYMGIELYPLEEIWQDIQIMLERTFIPAIYVDLDRIINNAGEMEFVGDAEDEDEFSQDTIENLFIRLNSGGTPLRGEELNYSILKSRLDRNLQHQLEDACLGFCSPARFVTLAFRLYQHITNQIGIDALSMHIKPKQIQIATGRAKGDFADYIEDIITSKKIDNLRCLLCYDPITNPHGLPQFISIAEKAPEIMFLLLYRLWIMNDSFSNSDQLKKMIGIITMFTWLGHSSDRREYVKLLRKVAIHLKQDQEDFWSAKLVKTVSVLDTITDKPILVLPITPARFLSEKPDYSNLEQAFFSRYLYNIDFLLYAQRDFLHLFFSNKDYALLEDTNRPYDLDHIFPQNWIRNKRNIDPDLKIWYNSIGNLRAWPYTFNRSDQDNPPQEKLNIDQKSFSELCKHMEINLDFKKDILYKWSICDAEKWGQIKIKKYTDLKKNTENIISLIKARACHIYEIWYTELNISDLTES